ncbi:MAG: glycosyltransferase family A protein, partial [Bacteroidetes bacterium]|nr:glycosyltransferase family A protein [Bacteroidota bacterium]
MSNLYINRYAFPRRFLDEKPSDSLGIVVTIPCFNEPDLITSLDSLRKCKKPESHVEIIVVINQGKQSSEAITDQNLKSLQDAQQWAIQTNTMSFATHIIYVNDLPQKHAGVGLARKIVMDEAVRRFEAIGNKDGIIACFDADAKCDDNYLINLESHFQQNPKTPGCSIHFEHPLNVDNQEAILYYELFLRYYVNALHFAGFPMAFQTIGSSMAVRSWAYQKQGGMNKRKAGEDFYFLQKIISLGNFTELNSTTVIPSCRKSDRVPFGTGRAMLDWGNGENDLKETYNPRIFEDLKVFFASVDALCEGLDFNIPGSIN